MIPKMMKFLTFDRFESEIGSSENIPSFLRGMESAMPDYNSHSTRAYQVENTVCYATEMTMNLAEEIKEEEPSPQLVSALRKYGVSDLGRGPKFKKNAPRVSYVIYDTRQLHLEWQKRSPRSDTFSKLKGDSLLTLDENLYKFKDISFPMTRALYGVDGERCSKPMGDIPYHLSLTSNFVQPSWFMQEKHSRIIVPDTDIADFLDVSLGWSSSNIDNLNEPFITVNSIRVELQELTWCKLNLGEAPSWKLRRMLLREEKNMGLVLVSAKATPSSPQIFHSYNLRKHLYKCRLPKLGPTFFAGGLSRCYGIQITLEVDFGNNCKTTTLGTFSEICVAKQQFAFLRRESASPVHFSGKPSPVFCLTIIEKFNSPSELLRSSLIEKLHEVSQSSDFEYLAHQTDTFSVHHTIFAISKIDVSRLLPERDEKTSFQALEEYGTTEFGSGPSSVEGKDLIICEISRSSDVWGKSDVADTVEGGLFLKTNGCLLKYTFPYHSPLNFLWICKSRFSVALTHLDYEFPFELTLRKRFNKSSSFEQEAGAKVIVPGMALREFISLEFSLPFEYSVAKERSVTKFDDQFVIKELRVSLVEDLRSNSCRHFGELARIKVLLVNQCEDHFKWSDFKSESKDSEAIRTIPSEMFDCVIPDVGPTFFSNDMCRCYSIRFYVVLKCNDSWLAHTVFSNIKIAQIAQGVVPLIADLPPAYS